MTDNELLATTEVEIFTFDQPGVVGADTFDFAAGDVTVDPIDPVTLLAGQVDEVLPVAPEPVPMCWATEGGASFDVDDFDFYYALLGDQLFEMFHLVPYDAAVYG